MIFREIKLLSSILDTSPVFKELSIKEKELLMRDLVDTYPHLLQHISDYEVGYEASWLAKQFPI